jgi:transcriptional regulator with XRE-family HTH domain
MASRIQSYLRTYRKRNGFTQDEMAFLLGGQSGSKISRFERLVRKPNLETALACQAIFGVQAQDIFSGTQAAVEQAIAERARLLSRRLHEERRKNDPEFERKMAVIDSIARRCPPGARNKYA